MKTIIIGIVLALLVSMAYAGDIVTMPTANQLKQGQVDVAYYHLGLKDQPVDNVQFQTLYVGITNEIEIDVHRMDPKANQDKTATLVNASFSLMRETLTMPDLVIGARNIFETKTTSDPTFDSDDRSYFLSAAKTLGLPAGGPPKPPFVRLHASLGTADPSLLHAPDRHEGLFGGVQALLTPEIGLVALHDGEDIITGLTYTKMGLTLKGGTYGDHWWVGVAYAK